MVRAGARGEAQGQEWLYDERLRPTWWMWLLWVGLVLTFAVVYSVLPVADLAVAAIVLVLSGLSGAGLWAWGSARVAVSRHELHAGLAHVPVDLLGRPEPLDREAAARVRGRDYEPRAYHLLRAWVPTAVRVPLHDPEDPTPYWFVSTRHPDRLAAALEQARAAGRGRT